MKQISIATLLTCHNRREKTITCLDLLFNQELDKTCHLMVYLVDAGSTDGTVEAIKKKFPQVRLFCGNDSLYWCGGMRYAWSMAMKKDCDFYLWLNNDTFLFSGAIQRLLKTAHETREKEGDDGIIAGSCLDPETGQYTYGGKFLTKQRQLSRFYDVIPSEEIQRCDTFNGNCVLVSRKVFQSVGNISPDFTQVIGDIDYGLRAKSKGINSWIVPGYVGTCIDDSKLLWGNAAICLKERLHMLHGPKGLPPREWMVFTRRYMGISWPLYMFTLYLRVFFPRLFEIWEDKKGMAGDKSLRKK